MRVGFNVVRLDFWPKLTTKPPLSASHPRGLTPNRPKLPLAWLGFGEIQVERKREETSATREREN